jgi:Zn-dependent membrane protease YugP
MRSRFALQSFLAILDAAALSPAAGVLGRAASIAQDGLVAGVVPDVIATAPVEIGAAVRALTRMQPDTLARAELETGDGVDVLREVALCYSASVFASLPGAVLHH